MNDESRKPADIAVALHYDGKRAPRVTASGRNEVAERIREIAIEHGIPMFDNPELAMLLGTLDLGEEIPEALYRAVAEIIAFAYYLSDRATAI